MWWAARNSDGTMPSAPPHLEQTTHCWQQILLDMWTACTNSTIHSCRGYGNGQCLAQMTKVNDSLEGRRTWGCLWSSAAQRQNTDCSSLTTSSLKPDNNANIPHSATQIGCYVKKRTYIYTTAQCKVDIVDIQATSHRTWRLAFL